MNVPGSGIGSAVPVCSTKRVFVNGNPPLFDDPMPNCKSGPNTLMAGIPAAGVGCTVRFVKTPAVTIPIPEMVAFVWVNDTGGMPIMPVTAKENVGVVAVLKVKFKMSTGSGLTVNAPVKVPPPRIADETVNDVAYVHVGIDSKIAERIRGVIHCLAVNRNM